MNKSEGVGAAFTVGVLGDANVGKSTLLNALVGTRSLLPSAGVGPVTAVPIRLRHASEHMLALTMASGERLLELAYAVETLDALVGGRAVSTLEYTALDAAVRADLRAAAREEHASTHASTQPAIRIAHIRKRAQLLVTGDADSQAPLALLRSGMRTLIGLPPLRGEPRAVLDEHVVFRCRQLLRVRGSLQPQPFELDDPTAMERLAVHATGALSVLTTEIAIGLPSELLRHIDLVDLPGVGISTDAYQQETWRWLQHRREALVLVCSRGGISAACRDLLLQSGILERLLHESMPLPRFIIVVTKLDGEALQRRRLDRSKSLPQHFARLAQEIVPVMHGQLRDLLTLAARSSSPARIRLLAERVPVIAAVAPSYLELHARDPELQPLFKTIVQTNIPRVAATLTRLASSVFHEPPESTVSDPGLANVILQERS